MNMNMKEVKYCSLCHRNGEAESLFRAHNLKTPDGRVVTCPVLRNYCCTLCGATKDSAHTLRYCPLNKDGAYNQGASLSELKKKRNAAGSYSGRGVMLCQPLPREVREQAEHPTVTRIRILEEEAARLRADYSRQQSYVAIRTFPATTFPTPPASITPPDSPPRHHHRHTTSTNQDLYNGGRQSQLADYWSLRRQQDLGDIRAVTTGQLPRDSDSDYVVIDMPDEQREDVGKLLAELRLGTSEV